jgi:hypothetical protein
MVSLKVQPIVIRVAHVVRSVAVIIAITGD